MSKRIIASTTAIRNASTATTTSIFYVFILLLMIENCIVVFLGEAVIKMDYYYSTIA